MQTEWKYRNLVWISCWKGFFLLFNWRSSVDRGTNTWTTWILCDCWSHSNERIQTCFEFSDHLKSISNACFSLPNCFQYLFMHDLTEILHPFLPLFQAQWKVNCALWQMSQCKHDVENYPIVCGVLVIIVHVTPFGRCSYLNIAKFPKNGIQTHTPLLWSNLSIPQKFT